MIASNLKSILFLLLILTGFSVSAQKNLEDVRWRTVIHSQPDEWYGSEEAMHVANNVLLYQKDVGGWPKDIAIHKELSKKEKKELKKLQSAGVSATTDNNATTQEMLFLSKVYGKTGHEPYKAAFLRGLDYLLEAQYDNGGWPQYYPLRSGYYTHITYNDGSMVHIMEFLKAISEKSDEFSIIADDARLKRAGEAYDKGIEVTLKAQYKQNGVLTVWCAQHDEVTLEPARARSYELPSLSGAESSGIVRMLMDIENPSEEVIESVKAAVAWFERSKIAGIRVEGYRTEDGERDIRVVKDPSAKPVWGRFYNLDDNRPFFCDRDGIKKYSLAEIGHERRNGYSWYSSGPQSVFDKYEKWEAKWVPEETGYMFSYFTGNGEDGLHLAYSDDGLKWKALYAGRSFLIPEVGRDKLMRDPCIIRGGEGLFHMVWTVSWAEKGIGYASSTDLVNWSEQLYIPVMEHEDSAMNCWAPELFYDEDSGMYMIYWATTIAGKYPETLKYARTRTRDHRMYYVTTRDFKTFSETKQLYNQGFNVIDAVIVREGEEYVMLLKDETLLPEAQKNIKIARSKTLTHGYGKPGTQISPEGVWVEGPSVMKSGDEWILYYDQYRLHAMGGMKSSDLEHWTDISDQISFPEGTRHGTAFKVPIELYESLMFNDIYANSEEEETFNKLYESAGKTLFSDDCVRDWSEKWHLDGKIGYVENSEEGMDFHAGTEARNDAHHAVLWTRETFSGDLMIEYDWTRLDTRNEWVNIIYIESTGSGEGDFAKDVFEWNEFREVPSMRTYYNNTNTLHISYAALSPEDGDYVRARRYRPDVGTGLKGTDLGATYGTGFFETGVKHHITIIKKGYDMYMKVSNDEQTELYLWNYSQHPEITEGRIALRHMYTRSSRYKNFVVKAIRH